MKILPRDFYARDTTKVAKDLLGKILVRELGTETISGIITETEAYRFKDDPASHSYRGITERNRAMFGQVGCAYVYFTYGMYHCVNAVARSKNFDAGAVLIRAIKPKTGIKTMIKNRKTEQLSNLANGPAKLTQALCIDKNLYGVDLTKKTSLYITEGNFKKNKIICHPRIGIKKATDKQWNFKIEI